MTLYSLVNSLTEVPEIKQVQIQINGANLDSLAGHVDLTNPLTRDESLIKK
jgi:germination protein M